MIKEALFTLIGSGVLAVCELQAQAVTTPMVTLKQPRFNLGVKAGFNSLRMRFQLTAKNWNLPKITIK